jgi:CheY-like chemotaxis protein/HPt (histidine-containing phosphotransfer) domain-containing protein
MHLSICRCIAKPVTQSILLNAITSAMGAARADECPQDELTADRCEHFVPRSILLAEDGVVNRQVAVGLLEKRGHHVTVVDNGQRAVEACRDKTFDLILMDVQMPVLDGFAATAAIRESEAKSDKHTPIIAMTAHAMMGDRERCLAAGMDDYVSKPFRPRALFEAVERVAPAASNEGAISNAAPSPRVSEPECPQTCDSSSQAFDRDEALRNVGGSSAVLTEMIELFATECPKQMAGIAAAHESGDPHAVMRAAHTLKGSLALFAAEAAAAAARRIEMMARDGNLEEYPEAWAELERHVGEVLQALRALEPANH